MKHDLPSNITFEQWIGHIFDHPVSKPEWYWTDETSLWNPEDEPDLTVQYLTRLFRESDQFVDQFSPGQINVGLWYLTLPAASNYGFVWLDADVPLDQRVAGLLSVADLYEKYFARVCTHYYGHLGWGPDAPSEANSICYMFWDCLPMYARSKRAPDPCDESMSDEHKAIEDACLAAMERTLQLDHPACLEGALHGLGHWCYDYPDRIHVAIDRLLVRETLHPVLRNYAIQARTGYVL